MLFAGASTDADAAFEQVTRLRNPAGHAALSWTTKWQLPDRHRPGLEVAPWEIAMNRVRSIVSHVTPQHLSGCAFRQSRGGRSWTQRQSWRQQRRRWMQSSGLCWQQSAARTVGTEPACTGFTAVASLSD